MLTALVLICSVAVTADLRDCTRYNATAVMRLPAEFANPATCLMHGQAYLADTSIGRELGDNDRSRSSAREATWSMRPSRGGQSNRRAWRWFVERSCQ